MGVKHGEYSKPAKINNSDATDDSGNPTEPRRKLNLDDLDARFSGGSMTTGVPAPKVKTYGP